MSMFHLLATLRLLFAGAVCLVAVIAIAPARAAEGLKDDPSAIVALKAVDGVCKPYDGVKVVELKFDGNNKVTDDDLKHLSGLHHLEILNLMSAPKITDAGLAHVAEKKTLKQLNLAGSIKITDAGMKHVAKLSNLEVLYLTGARVHDAGLTELESLKKLKKLFLKTCPVTDAGVAKLKKALPECEIRH